MDSAKVADYLVKWLKDYAAGAGIQNAVFGISGGLDSAVLAGLAVRAFGEGALGIIMPCYSDPEDEEHARLCARVLGLPVTKVELEGPFDTLCEAFQVTSETPRLAVANIKPRLRMLTLQYFAAERRALVLGGTNLSEWLTGYYTKHGDTGVDLMPLVGLVKGQVRELAAYLGVPQVIIDKTPSAGLWPGQTDEDEMGITYDELDNYILRGEAEPRVKEIVDRMVAGSEHKRRLPPQPELTIAEISILP